MNPGKGLQQRESLNIVWGYEYPGDARTVDVHIRRLREKIETNPSDPKICLYEMGSGLLFQGLKNILKRIYSEHEIPDHPAGGTGRDCSGIGL